MKQRVVGDRLVVVVEQVMIIGRVLGRMIEVLQMIELLHDFIYQSPHPHAHVCSYQMHQPQPRKRLMLMDVKLGNGNKCHQINIIKCRLIVTDFITEGQEIMVICKRMLKKY